MAIFCEACETMLFNGEQLDPNCLTCLAIFDPNKKKPKKEAVSTETNRKEAIQGLVHCPPPED